MSRYQKYPAYKDSGVEWIGEIPEHWEVKRLKQTMRLITNKSIEETQNIALENIESWSGKYIPSDTEFEGEGINFQVGDILFGKLRPYLAKAYLAEFPGAAVGDFHVMRPNTKSIHGRYALYLILNHGVISIINGSTFGAKMPRVSWDFMANIQLPIPPFKEQQAIANFLDCKTAQIETLIAKKEILIKKLDEKRTALIIMAVTKGLAQSVPMKESGVNWIGKIPEHWTVKPLRYLAKLQTGNTPLKSDNENYSTQGLLWIKPDNLSEFNPILSTKEYLTSEGKALVKSIPPYSSLVCCIGTVGKFGFSSYDVATNQQINAVIFSPLKINKRFGLYLIASTESEHIRLANSNVVSILNSTSQGSIMIPVPPLQEQASITCYLDRETSKIDQMVAKVQDVIERLKEYRNTLITDTITGKISISWHQLKRHLQPI